MAKKPVKREESPALRPPEEKDVPVEELPEEPTGEIVFFAFKHSGPLPLPDILKGYEEALPGSADRILQIAEKNADSRRGIEKNETDALIKQAKYGQVFAFIFGLAGLGLAAYFAYLGKGWFSLSIFMGEIFSLLGVYAVGKLKRFEQEKK